MNDGHWQDGQRSPSDPLAETANRASLSFGELLREHRRAAGLTQEEMAERAGISPRSVSELERGGPHAPRRDTVALLARALGLTASDREMFEGLAAARRRTRAPAAASPRAPRIAPPTAPERPKHNVPRSLTSFVGREQELKELAPVLGMARLLTLVGSGGVGKTRLAQELVRAHAADYAHGACFVALAGVDDPALVPRAATTALGLGDFHGRSAIETLVEYLGPKQLLLVLDNCEHLAAACAELTAGLLRTCPGLRVLASSREPLGVAGEVAWRVPPLQLPDPRRQSPAELTGAAAARLFVERARTANNTFAPTPRNAPAIARICALVEGLPLALELAAARTRLLTVEQLADRLARDVGVLGTTERGGMPQHRTIRATIDWSYALLSEPEQVLLRRLSVFAGGWTLETAEEVCASADLERSEILGPLAGLVDKSMVLVETRGAVARYRLLEPVRQCAAEWLAAAGEAATYQARHATALLELAMAHDVAEQGRDEVPSLDRLEAEHDNIRVALRWALSHGEVEAALRAAAGLFRLWERRGHFREGCAWLEQALAAAGGAPASVRGRALNALSFLYWRGGDAERAMPIAEQALALHREAGHAVGVSWAVGNLGAIAYYRGDSEAALALLEESVAVAREAGYAPLLSLALTFLGRTVLWVKGPWDRRAAALLEKARGIAEAAQSLYATGHALATLGDLAWRRGDLEQAASVWGQALTIRSRLADRRGIAGCLERLALALAASDHLESAAWLFGAADAQHEALGIELRHDEEIDHAHLLAATRQRLGDAFEPAWLAGRSATPDEAIARAVEDTRDLEAARLAHSA